MIPSRTTSKRRKNLYETGVDDTECAMKVWGEGVLEVSNAPVTEIARSLPTLGASYVCLKNI